MDALLWQFRADVNAVRLPGADGFRVAETCRLNSGRGLILASIAGGSPDQKGIDGRAETGRRQITWLIMVVHWLSRARTEVVPGQRTAGEAMMTMRRRAAASAAPLATAVDTAEVAAGGRRSPMGRTWVGDRLWVCPTSRRSAGPYARVGIS